MDGSRATRPEDTDLLLIALQDGAAAEDPKDPPKPTDGRGSLLEAVRC